MNKITICGNNVKALMGTDDRGFYEIKMNTITKAYQTGYLHGYEHGVDANPYDHDDINRVQYKHGYDAGVHDYCIEIDREEETE